MLVTAVTAQIPVGSWRLHLPYNNALHIAYSPSKVYCTTGENLFSYNLKDNSVEKLSKISGLSDFGVSAIAFSTADNLLLIGYENGNIDILSGNTVTNISDLKNKTLPASKTINHILIDGKWAYLSCGFGILLLDLEKKEVKDTYVFGPGGTYIKVHTTAILNNDIYAATASGIYKADKTSSMLVDYSRWQLINTIPNYNESFIQTIVDNGVIYAVYSNPASGKDSIYYFRDNAWSRLSIDENVDIYNVSFSSDQIFISTGTALKTFNKNHQIVSNLTEYPNVGGFEPRESYMDPGGNLWIADHVNGLVQQAANGSYLQIKPNGPVSSRIKSFHFVNGNLYTTAGGTDISNNNLFNQAEFSLFSDEEWKSYTNPGVFDYMNVKTDPVDKDLIYISSWGRGIYTYKAGQIVSHYDDSNSSLQNAIPGSPYTRVSGMEFDSEGNLWAANNHVNNTLSVLKKSGEWLSFAFRNAVNSSDLGDIAIDNKNNIWVVLLKGGGIFALNTNNTLDNPDDDRYIKFKPKNAYGESVANVYSIIKDLEGNIWVGTDNGPVVYSNPEDVFEGDTDGKQPLLNRSGSNVVDPLLGGEIIKAIAVDGANRKWIGTERGGAFLVSALGDSSLRQFNTSNSPILSNTINAIGIHDNTGEVFFGTDRGIISYRSDATKAAEDFGDVYVFPNPVRPDYKGKITVTGLIRDANIKITDIAGNLVYETTTLGGQIVWDGNNLDGRRVASGIYLIFCTNDDGSKTKITKLLFLK